MEIDYAFLLKKIKYLLTLYYISPEIIIVFICLDLKLNYNLEF